jgi:hypothetical protein
MRRLLVIAGASVLLARWAFLVAHPWQSDAFGYWEAWHRQSLYGLPWLEYGAFVYAPPVGQAIWPFSLAPFALFSAAIATAQLLALVWLVGPIWGAFLLLVPVFVLEGFGNPIWATTYNGNIQILLAAAIAAGVRHPATWAFVILTKVTPGVGLLWFVVRREWRNLGIALGATGAIAALSFVLAPGLWADWLGLLRAAASADTVVREPFIAVALAPRLVAAVVLVIWGARTGREWTLLVGGMLALPAIALGGLSLGLIGAVRGIQEELARRDRRQRNVRSQGVEPVGDPA